MTSGVRPLIVIAVALVALAAGTATAQAQTVARPQAATTVREYQGILAFSTYDPAIDRWRLAVRRPGQDAETLPVAPSRLPFDADIGPNSNGRPQLIYRRCEGAGTCDLYVYALEGDGGERPVHNANDPDHDDVAPTIWRGRIAWTRIYGSGRDARPVVYTKLLTAPRSRPSTRLPGVPERRCGDVERVCGPTTARSVMTLELWGANLAQTVAYTCRGCSGVARAELRLVRVPARSSAQLAVQQVGLGGQVLVGPSFADGRLGWYRTCLGDPAGCRGGVARPYRYRLSNGRYERAGSGPVRVDGFADAGARQFLVLGCSVETMPEFNRDCRIEERAAPAYQRTSAPRD
jgi:hypothetical protein